MTNTNWRELIKPILESYLEIGINDYENKIEYFPTNLMNKTREITDLIDSVLKDQKAELLKALKREIVEVPFGADKDTEVVLWSDCLEIIKGILENK